MNTKRIGKIVTISLLLVMLTIAMLSLSACKKPEKFELPKELKDMATEPEAADIAGLKKIEKSDTYAQALAKLYYNYAHVKRLNVIEFGQSETTVLAVPALQITTQQRTIDRTNPDVFRVFNQQTSFTSQPHGTVRIFIEEAIQEDLKDSNKNSYDYRFAARKKGYNQDTQKYSLQIGSQAKGFDLKYKDLDGNVKEFKGGGGVGNQIDKLIYEVKNNPEDKTDDFLYDHWKYNKAEDHLKDNVFDARRFQPYYFYKPEVEKKVMETGQAPTALTDYFLNTEKINDEIKSETKVDHNKKKYFEFEVSIDYDKAPGQGKTAEGPIAEYFNVVEAMLASSGTPAVSGTTQFKAGTFKFSVWEDTGMLRSMQIVETYKMKIEVSILKLNNEVTTTQNYYYGYGKNDNGGIINFDKMYNNAFTDKKVIEKTAPMNDLAKAHKEAILKK